MQRSIGSVYTHPQHARDPEEAKLDEAAKEGVEEEGEDDQRVDDLLLVEEGKEVGQCGRGLRVCVCVCVYRYACFWMHVCVCCVWGASTWLMCIM